PRSSAGRAGIRNARPSENPRFHAESATEEDRRALASARDDLSQEARVRGADGALAARTPAAVFRQRRDRGRGRAHGSAGLPGNPPLARRASRPEGKAQQDPVLGTEFHAVAGPSVRSALSTAHTR